MVVPLILVVLLAALACDARGIEVGLERYGDYYVFEGDMLLTEGQAMELMQRQMVPRGQYSWPRDSEGRLLIKYYIGDANVSQVRSAVAHWAQHTCVQFQELQDPEPGDGPYIKFEDGGMCASSLGKLYDGPNPIILSSMCSLPAAIHEIGHRLGLVHEQSRADRDSYVRVMLDNIEGDKAFNFQKTYGLVDYGVPYDYNSIMHYDAMSFSNGEGPSLLTKDPLYQEVLGQHRPGGGLTFMDAKIINLAYQCMDDWQRRCPTSLTCLNSGYVKADEARQGGGTTCRCVCPLGTEGARCQTRLQSYNEAVLKKYSPYTSTVITSGALTSVVQQRFTKVIKAPSACERVVLSMNQFKLFPRYSSECPLEYLIVRLTSSETTAGNTYCGSEIVEGTVFRSEGNTMIVHARVREIGKFDGDITFEPIPGCKE